MNNQLEFEPALSNFLDDGFSNVKGKEKRKAKRTARKEKRVAKRAAKKGGGVTETVAVETATETTSAPTAEAKTDVTKPAATDSTTTDTKTEETKGTVAPPADDKGGDGGEEKKILGMKPIVAYGVIALVAVGGFFLVRNMMSKSSTVVVAS